MDPSWTPRTLLTSARSPVLLSSSTQIQYPSRSRDATSAPFPAAATSSHRSAPESQSTSPAETAAAPRDNIPPSSDRSGSSGSERIFPYDKPPPPNDSCNVSSSAGCWHRPQRRSQPPISLAPEFQGPLVEVPLLAASPLFYGL